MNMFTLTAFAAGDGTGDAGKKPLNYVGSYLTTISNNTSTTGADITSGSVPVKPTIKVVVDKNVVDDAIWAKNQACVSMQDSNGANVPSNVFRISPADNFGERTNMFITPLNNLNQGGKYKIVISPNMEAKNGNSTLGMTTNNQPVVVNFTVEGTATVSVSGVTLNKTAATVEVGKTDSLAATVAPANASNKAVSWSSANTAVATVNQNGVVNGVKAGTAVITVKTTDGDKTATCTVTVKATEVPTPPAPPAPAKVAVSGVTMNKTATTIEAGKTDSLAATVAPANASNKAVNWSSGNTAVATVNQNGVVTAVKAGTAVITVKTADGGKIATCTVTVKAATEQNNNKPVYGIVLNKKISIIYVGRIKKLTATVVPSNASNKNVIWSSSKPYIATVSKNGVVHAVKPGNAIIFVQTPDGKYSSSCIVFVKGVRIFSFDLWHHR
jgi:uncharacterized protein YjdB